MAFVSLCTCVQFWFPVGGPGTAPKLEAKSFAKMPLLICAVMGGVALLGIILGDRTKYELVPKYPGKTENVPRTRPDKTK